MHFLIEVAHQENPEDSSPPLACPAPLVAIAPQGITDWPSSAAAAFAATTLTTSPSGTQLLQTVVTPQGLSPSSRLESGPSAFSSVVPSITIHPSAVCSISLPIPSPPRVGFVSPPSVSIPTFIGSCSASTGAAPSLGASASAGVQQFSAFADVYPSLMCFPDILKQLQAAHCTPATVTTTISTSSQSTPAPPHEDVLRSHMNAATFKPIPNNEKRVDLARFRVKDPGEWLVDDVVAWMLDVAKRHSIPFEEMNMHRFASLNGQAMLMMTEQNFMEKDPVWGRLIYSEFKKCASNHEDTLIDDYMKNNPSDEDSPMRPSTSQDAPKLALLHPPAPQIQSQLQQSLNQALNQTINQALNQTLNQSLFTQHSIQTLNQSLASSLAAGLSTGLSPMSLGLLPNGLSPSSPMFNQMQPKISPQPASNEMMKYQNAPASISSSEYEESVRVHRHEPKIKKNKDGKPRKRSQHTKGNKLWEFIRDALKDPSTCPSVVRWEDPVEGVFRIVESEKLARLWGEKKNNTKMTYEKLSRAMRRTWLGRDQARKAMIFSTDSISWYYYNTKILLPVSGRRLVYKFGPLALGRLSCSSSSSSNLTSSTSSSFEHHPSTFPVTSSSLFKVGVDEEFDSDVDSEADGADGDDDDDAKPLTFRRTSAPQLSYSSGLPF